MNDEPASKDSCSDHRTLQELPQRTHLKLQAPSGKLPTRVHFGKTTLSSYHITSLLKVFEVTGQPPGGKKTFHRAATSSPAGITRIAGT